MCEATNVIKTLERIRDRLELSENERKTGTWAGERMLYDITMCIAQLQAAKQGESWFNPDVALAKYYAAKSGGVVVYKEYP